MIQASRTYRCKDNSLLYVDFYTNNTVQVRTAKDAAADDPDRGRRPAALHRRRLFAQRQCRPDHLFRAGQGQRRAARLIDAASGDSRERLRPFIRRLGQQPPDKRAR